MQPPRWLDARMRAYFETMPPDEQNAVLCSSSRVTDQQRAKETPDSSKAGEGKNDP